MEIPHASKYENIKDVEKLPSIENNFLNDKLNLDLTMKQEVLDNLPKITDDELKTGVERYRYFIGEVNNIEKNEAVVNILGVVEEEGNVKKQLYSEEKEQVIIHNSEAIKARVKDISTKFPGFKNSELVGDIHTHPGTKESLGLNEEENVWDCSDGDIEGIIKLYEDGTIPQK